MRFASAAQNPSGSRAAARISCLGFRLGQIALGLLEFVAQLPGPRIEQASAQRGWLPLQFEMGIKVGLGKGVCQIGCEHRVAGVELDLDHVALTAQPDLQLGEQLVAQPRDAVTATIGFAPPLALQIGVLVEFESARYTARDPWARYDVSLGGHIVRASGNLTERTDQAVVGAAPHHDRCDRGIAGGAIRTTAPRTTKSAATVKRMVQRRATSVLLN